MSTPGSQDALPLQGSGAVLQATAFPGPLGRHFTAFITRKSGSLPLHLFSAVLIEGFAGCDLGKLLFRPWKAPSWTLAVVTHCRGSGPGAMPGISRPA